jgi:hypothetical protein
MEVTFAPACGRCEPNHPAESHALGMENSLHPQSRQTDTSGDGVIGGWLMVRGILRYNRISAGTMENDEEWHFGQIMEPPLLPALQTSKIRGKINSIGFA